MDARYEPDRLVMRCECMALAARAATLAASATLVMALPGCASTTPYVLTGKYSAPAQPATAKSARACSVFIGSIIDKRTDASTLGSVKGRPVHSPASVDAWLRTVFSNLDKFGVTIVSADSPGAIDAPTVGIELMTAWVSTLTDIKTANIVIRVHYRRGKAESSVKTYRGMTSSPNWMSTDAELQRMVDRALTQLLQEMSADIRKSCDC